MTVAFLVGGAAAQRGRPPLSRLSEQYAQGDGKLVVCPICFSARRLAESDLAANARLVGATPMFEWIGDDNASHANEAEVFVDSNLYELRGERKRQGNLHSARARQAARPTQQGDPLSASHGATRASE